MKIDSRTVIADSISPLQLERYLQDAGWVEDGRLEDVAIVWHRSEKEYEEFELLQPLRADLKDYTQRLLAVLETLAEFESRNFTEVAKAARKKAQISAKNRQREFKKAQRDRGLQQVTVWVPIEDAQKLRDTAKEMCEK